MTAQRKSRILLCGVGGQGILFSTRILAETAFSRNLGATISETHGMAQRGGSVVSHLLLGGFHSSLVRHGAADLILGFDPDEGIRGLRFLRRGGTVVLNADPEKALPGLYAKSLDSVEAQVYRIHATTMARALQAPVTANLVLIGYASKVPGFFLDSGDVRETITRLSPARFLDANLRAFEAGLRHEGSSGD